MTPNKELIEKRFKDNIDRYIHDGCPTGHFMDAVLRNDLKEAIGRGDSEAIENIPHIVAYLYNDCPSSCWGSDAKVKEWYNQFAEQTN